MEFSFNFFDAIVLEAGVMICQVLSLNQLVNNTEIH